MIDWKPIAEFKPEELAKFEFFNVWMHDPNAAGGDDADRWPEIAQWVDGRFEGAWRHIDGLEDLEPIAFALINPYEPEGEAHEPVDFREVRGILKPITPSVDASAHEDDQKDEMSPYLAGHIHSEEMQPSA